MSAPIEVKGVSLAYPTHNKARRLRDLLRTPVWDTAKATAGDRWFWALRDVSMQVQRGEIMGLMGPNGSGKSTLLKTMAGIYQPDSGSCKVLGRTIALLELGAGFRDELSGIENVRWNSSVLGITPAQLQKLMPSIVDFADLGDFIHQPLRTYSSGMRARLGFAMASAVAPDNLLVDEVLAVGDEHFQQKCLARIAEMAAQGTSIIVVSHNTGMLERLCQRAVLLQRGEIVTQGSIHEVALAYRNLDPHSPVAPQESDAHNSGVRIESVRLTNVRNETLEAISWGDSYAVEIDLELSKPLPQKSFVAIAYHHGPLHVSQSTYVEPKLESTTGSLTLRFSGEAWQLVDGHYRLSVAVYGPGGNPTYAIKRGVIALQSRGAPNNEGIWAPGGTWQCTWQSRAAKP